MISDKARREAIERLIGHGAVAFTSLPYVGEFLRALRGHNPASNEKEDLRSRRAVAVEAGIHVPTVYKAEQSPELVSLATLRHLVGIHGFKVAVVFYKENEGSERP